MIDRGVHKYKGGEGEGVLSKIHKILKGKMRYGI